jgi:hypothetical protein
MTGMADSLPNQLQIVREIEPIIIVATLSAVLAGELQSTNSPFATLFVLSTGSLIFGGMIYYFIKTTAHEKWNFLAARVFSSLNNVGFFLFLLGAIGYLPIDYRFTAIVVFGFIYVPLLADLYIDSAKRLNRWRDKQSMSLRRKTQ